MLPLALMLLTLAILCGVLGYGGAAVPFAAVAQVLFVIFVVLFLLSVVAGVIRNGPSADN
jgi:uncharacterized membrane protein YtjA (UPF0391 family)